MEDENNSPVEEIQSTNRDPELGETEAQSDPLEVPEIPEEKPVSRPQLVPAITNVTKVKPAQNETQSVLQKKTIELEKWIVHAQEFQQQIPEKIAALGNDDNLSKFKSEYNKVFRVIQRATQNAIKLREKCDDVALELQMNADINTDTSKLDSDATTLKILKSQIDRAEVMLEHSNRREETSKAEIRLLRQDIGNLTTTIKNGVSLSAAQERSINELIATKHQYTKDLESELENIVSLRHALANIGEKIESTERERGEIDRDMASLKERNAAKKIEIDEETRNKERLERDLREMRVVVTIKSQEAHAKQTAVNRATEDIATIEGQIKHQKSMIEKLLRDQESLGTRTVKLQQEFDEQVVLGEQLATQNELVGAELKAKEQELMNHRAEVKKVMKIKDVLVKKNRILEEQKLQAENERKVHRSYNDNLMAQTERVKRNLESVKKNLEDLSREKDILEANLKKTQGESSKLTNLLILLKQQQTTTEVEIARFLKEAAEHRRDTKLRKQERDAYIKDSADISAQTIASLSELKSKEVQLFELNRQTFQAETKLKHQQNLYETVQSDRNLHAKKLIESQGSIIEMKRALKIMNFQINGFKEDVNSKNAQLVKESGEYAKLIRDTELIREEIKTLNGQNELAGAYIKSQMAEELKLDQFVKEAEVERSREESSLNAIICERDNLSSQLLRRNNELAAVYDKIKTLSSSLLRSEVHYNDTLKRIRELRNEIAEERAILGQWRSETALIPLLKRHIIKLESQQTLEETKITALEQELENPINVHRWRKLEGSQPKVYDLILLLHTLQKKLISNTSEIRGREKVIDKMERTYLSLRSILLKQTGPESELQITELSDLLRDKTKQLRYMDTELNMYKAQVDEYSHDISKLDQRLLETKREFLRMYSLRLRGDARKDESKGDVGIEVGRDVGSEGGRGVDSVGTPLGLVRQHLSGLPELPSEEGDQDMKEQITDEHHTPQEV